MKNYLKRLFAAVLALVLTVSLVPPVAAAGDDNLNLPTATVKNLFTDELTENLQLKKEKAEKLGLNFAMSFSADEPTPEQLADYGDWYADFVLTVNKDVDFNAGDAAADGFLSGQYDEFSEDWLNVPFSSVEVAANESFLIMKYASKLLNEPGLRFKYSEVYSVVQEFNCGAAFSHDFLEQNPDFEVTLSLRVINPTETVSYPIGEEYVFKAEDLFVAEVDGDKFMTLSRAIAAADDGDTIYVKPGIIDERIAPWASDTTHASEKSITLLGGNHENNPMSAWDESKETVLTGGVYLGYDDNHCSDTTITIKGFTFTENGLVISGQENVHIENNRFVSITSIPTTNGTASNNAISVTGQTYQNMNGTAVIRNNVIGDVASDGINLRNSKDVIIEGNYISHTVNNAVTIQNGTAGGDVEITNNILMNWGTGGEGRAIRSNTPATVVITGNTMTNENAPEEFVKVTATESITAFSNGWNGENPTGKTGADKAYFLTDLETPIVKLLRDYYSNGSLIDICQPHNWTTTADGSNYYSENDCVTIYTKVCLDCGKISQPTAENQIIIPKAESKHAWSEDFQPGSNTHWHYCTNEGCTAKNDETGHTFADIKDPAYAVKGNDCAVEYIQQCSVCGKGNEEKSFWIAEENPVHAYDNGVVTKEATCTEAGVMTYTCTNEGCGHKKPETIAKKAHTEVEIPAKAATCTESGLTAGKKCSVCGTVTVAQTEITAKDHTEVELAAKAATCTETGLTAGKKCSVCGTVTVAQTEIAAKGHTEVEVAAKAATCTETGLTAGKKCSVCGTITVAQTEVAAAGHKLIKVEGKEATYSAAGVKEHYACSGCSALFADAEGKTEITSVVIPQLIKVEGTTAKVETGAVDSALTEAVEKAEESGTKAEVVIEVEKAVDTEASTDPSAPADTVKPEDVEKVVEVQLPVASIDKVVEAEANLTVVLPNATVTVDTEALKAVSDQAAGEAVTLVVEEVKTESLTVAQQKTVEKYDVAVSITAELICQTTGEKIWTEKANEEIESGSITVKLPFTPAENTKGSDYVVLFIDDDGSVTEIATEFVDGHLVFALEHFSDYVVVNTAAKAYPDSPATGDTANVALMVALVVVSLAGLAACVILVKKNRYISKR